MRRVQASAALLWVGYGIWINALPIIVANVIVGALALYSDWRLLRLSVCERKKAARLESIEEIQNLNVTHEVT